MGLFWLVGCRRQRAQRPRRGAAEAPCGGLCTVVSSLLLADDPCCRLFLLNFDEFFSEFRRHQIAPQLRARGKKRRKKEKQSQKMTEFVDILATTAIFFEKFAEI